MTLPSQSPIWDNNTQHPGAHFQQNNTTLPNVYIVPGVLVIHKGGWLKMATTDDFNSTASSAMPIIISIDKELRELKDDFFSFKKETRSDISELKRDVSTLKQDVSTLKQDVFTLKQDVAILKNDVATLKDDTKELKRDVSDIKGDIKAINASFNAIQIRFGWYLAIFASIIALIQYLK